MPRVTTTVGQLMVNDALPEDMRDNNRTLDKRTLTNLLRDLAKNHPEQYRDVTHRLSKIGLHAAYTTGGNSFGLEHMQPAKSVLAMRKELAAQLSQVIDNDDLTDEQRDEQIVLLMGRYADKQQKAIYEESLAEDNPLARQVASGSRGNPMNLASLRGSDMLYTDHRNRVLPFPVLRSYAQGLSPAEYWAGAYGARKGTMDTKFATQDAGFLSKQLNQIVHRSLITSLDRDDDDPTPRGLPVDVDDDENEGALLSLPAGGYKRNTLLTPKVLSDLKRRGVKRLLVRSPAVSGSPDGGVYARDAGVREFGVLPSVGENIGLAAAQALSEPLSQAQLSSKHSGGVASASSNKAVSGFDYINQLVQVPKTFKGGAAHAELDGLVQTVADAPAGGKYVMIENQQHYVGAGFDVKVKKGDKVEAGDVISEGTPNPSVIVQHKGIGEGRRYFINAFRQAFRDAGIKGHRRNIELLARGLINHVRLTDEIGDASPDDIMPYSMLEHRYQPRPGYTSVAPASAVGKYLERPYLHYSIGTKIRPSMLENFKEFGVPQLDVHDEPPPFEPEMVRGMANLQHDPDWITRMYGSGLKGGLQDATHYGATSDTQGTSYVPGLAHSVDFGRSGKVVTPKRDQFKVETMQSMQPISPLGKAAAALRAKLAATPMLPDDRQLQHLLRFQQRYGPQPEPGMLAQVASATGAPETHTIPAPERHLMQPAQAQAAKLPAIGQSPGFIERGLRNLGSAVVSPIAGDGALKTNQTWIDQYNQAIESGMIPDAATVQNVNRIYGEVYPEQFQAAQQSFTQQSQGLPPAQPTAAAPAPTQVNATLPTTQPPTAPAAQPQAPQPAAPTSSTTQRPQGRNLMPLFQMFPQQGEQAIRSMGPAALAGYGALFDMDAVKTLTQGGGSSGTSLLGKPPSKPTAPGLTSNMPKPPQPASVRPKTVTPM